MFATKIFNTQHEAGLADTCPSVLRRLPNPSINVPTLFHSRRSPAQPPRVRLALGRPPQAGHLATKGYRPAIKGHNLATKGPRMVIKGQGNLKMPIIPMPQEALAIRVAPKQVSKGLHQDTRAGHLHRAIKGAIQAFRDLAIKGASEVCHLTSCVVSVNCASLACQYWWM